MRFFVNLTHRGPGQFGSLGTSRTEAKTSNLVNAIFGLVSNENFHVKFSKHPEVSMRQP